MRGRRGPLDRNKDRRGTPRFISVGLFLLTQEFPRSVKERNRELENLSNLIEEGSREFLPFTTPFPTHLIYLQGSVPGRWASVHPSPPGN